MKWTWLFFIPMLICCKKSVIDEQQIETSQKTIIGKWKLTDYFKENEDGTGVWVPTETNNIQIIEFSADGDFSHNENVALPAGINKYKFIDPHKVILFSTSTSDTLKYFYKQDNTSELIFNPLCIELSCMRRHVRIE